MLPESLTPKLIIISSAPFSGRFRRVFSPVIEQDPPPSAAIKGIIILVRNPDSPTWRLSMERHPGAAPMPFMDSTEPSSRTSAPRALATARADSLSPHGEYPESLEVPSASAAAIMALWAKLLEEGIANGSRPVPLWLRP